MVDPKYTKSNTDSDDPSLVMPWIEMEDPRRMYVRSDNEAPRFK
jgi:hypothetical protein